MAEILKETVTTTTQDANTGTVINSPSRDSSKPIMATQIATAATSSQTTEYLIYFFFGALDILLGFRLVLKLMGANVASTFVSAIYGLSGIFTMPFDGIFRRAFAPGVETTAVLEPATIVAIIFYAVLSWGIVKLIRIFSGEQQPQE